MNLATNNPDKHGLLRLTHSSSTLVVKERRSLKPPASILSANADAAKLSHECNRALQESCQRFDCMLRHRPAGASATVVAAVALTFYLGIGCLYLHHPASAPSHLHSVSLGHNHFFSTICFNIFIWRASSLMRFGRTHLVGMKQAPATELCKIPGACAQNEGHCPSILPMPTDLVTPRRFAKAELHRFPCQHLLGQALTAFFSIFEQKQQPSKVRKVRLPPTSLGRFTLKVW